MIESEFTFFADDDIVFENNLDKSIALRSDCGYILNQMDYSIGKNNIDESN